MSPRRVSPSRSQGSPTPRHRKTRTTRSVGSLTPSSGRLSALIQFKDVLKDPFILSPVPTRRSVLNDVTDIEEPRRRSWWKKLNENSRDVMEVLSDNKILETNEAMEEYIDIEVLSQENKNYTIDLPETSDSESISSIVIPQRKLFTQKENQPQKKFVQVIGTRESLANLQKNVVHEKTINVAPKKLLNHASRSKPVFPAALLNLSPNKTVNKTREIPTAPVERQARNLFGNRPDLKRKNIFADFIVSESEDEVSEIQPHVFAFQNKMEHQTQPFKRHRTSDASSIADDKMGEWKHLPSSTMVENQLEISAAATPLRTQTESEEDIQHEEESQVISEDKSGIKDTKEYANEEVKSNEEVENGENICVQEENHTMSEDDCEKTHDIQHEEESQVISEDKSEIKDTKEYANEEVKSNEKVENGENICVQEENHTVSEDDCEKTYESEEDIQHEEESQVISEDKSEIKDTKEYANEEVKSNEKVENGENICVQEENHTISEDDCEKTHESEEDIQHEEESLVISEDKSEIKDTKEYANEEVKSNEEVENGENICVQEEHHTMSEDDCEKTHESAEDIQHEEESQVISEDKSEIKDTKEYANEEVKSNEEVENAENICVQEENHTMSEDDCEMTHESEEDIQHEEESQVISEDKSEIKDTTEYANEGVKSNEEVENAENICVQEENHTMSEDDCEMTHESEEDIQHEEESQVISEDKSEINDTKEYANEEVKSNAEVENAENICVQEENHTMSEDDCEMTHESEEDIQHEEESQVISEDKSEIKNTKEYANEEVKSNEEVENGENICVQEENHTMSEDDCEKTHESEEDIQHEEESQVINDDKSEMDENNEYANEEVKSNEEVENSENICVQEENHTISEDYYEKPHVSNTNEKSLEVIRHNKTKQTQSFIAKGCNTSLRRSSILKSMNLKHSMVPSRDDTGLSDGTSNSSAEGSGWDSHRTTRKTLRQTFGKDFSPRKSLRALVMEKSANRQTNVNDLTSLTSKLPQANSTELPHDDNDPSVSNHDVSKRTRQTTLELYLDKIKKQNMEKKLKLEEYVRNSLKAPIRDVSNTFKVPSRHVVAKKPKQTQGKAKAKPKSSLVPLLDLPQEFIDDMKYKPPKRFQPNNAAWITKRLYKFLEDKLVPKYDYKARVRAEKLVEAIYHFAKDLKRQEVASRDAVDVLKHEMARLDVVTTHFDFYQFFHEFMPREIRIKVVPDVVNKIPLPRRGIFSDILHGNTTQA